MSYRIDYGTGDFSLQKRTDSRRHLKNFIAAALLLFSFSVNQFWPDGCEKLQDFLLPGEKTPTALAADRLLNRIRDGVGFEEALRTFCLEILKDADPV